jgi:hypothetical protein
MKTALHFDRPDRMARKQLQCLEVRRFGPALAENLGEVEQVNVILQDEVSKAIHRQSPGVKLAQKRMILYRSPNPPGTHPQLVAEIFLHRLALAKFGHQEKSAKAQNKELQSKNVIRVPLASGVSSYKEFYGEL